MVRQPGPKEGSVGGFAVGPAFLGGQAFPERQVVLGGVFEGGASRALPPSLVAPSGMALS
jgi:hypothetical protein